MIHPFSHSTAANLLTSSLTQSPTSFIVQPGAYTFFFLADCLTYNLPSCFALNADSPYGLTLLPPSPTEKEYKGCITKTDRCGNGCNPNNDPALTKSVCINNRPMQWRIDRNEAVVLIGTTPPKAKYWSFTTYLMSQYYKESARSQTGSFTSWVQQTAVSCPNPPARCQNFASLDQPFNYLSGNFNAPFAVILTASAKTFRTIEQSIHQEIPEIATIHRVPLPTDVLNLGHDNDQRDMLTMLLRIAYPSNATAMRNYYKNTPISVLRVTPPPTTTTNTDTDYYTRKNAHFLPRTTGVDERGNTSTVTHAELMKDMEVLRDGILKAHDIGGANATSKSLSANTYNFMKPFFNTGLNCIDQGTECNGDSADTLYPISSNIYFAQGCNTIPVLTIGGILTVLMSVLLLCCGLRRQRQGRQGCPNPFKQRRSTSKSFNTLDTIVPEDTATTSPTTKTSSSRAVLIRLVLVSLFLSSLICMVPAIYLYAVRCHWGHAGTIDSGPKDVFVVYGVNHQTTGHSTYASVTAYRYSTLSGIVSQSSEKGYTNSANQYLPKGALHRSSNYLFAYSFARDCRGRVNCYEVALEELPVGDDIFWIERMYVNPISNTGPDSAETIMARVIHVWV